MNPILRLILLQLIALPLSFPAHAESQDQLIQRRSEAFHSVSQELQRVRKSSDLIQVKWIEQLDAARRLIRASDLALSGLTCPGESDAVPSSSRVLKIESQIQLLKQEQARIETKSAALFDQLTELRKALVRAGGDRVQHSRVTERIHVRLSELTPLRDELKETQKKQIKAFTMMLDEKPSLELLVSARDAVVEEFIEAYLQLSSFRQKKIEDLLISNSLQEAEALISLLKEENRILKKELSEYRSDSDRSPSSEVQKAEEGSEKTSEESRFQLMDLDLRRSSR